MLVLLVAASLGTSHFTATGPAACRQKVLEGVLALHSFMYDDARDSFVEAQKAAPCPIAYWGEAMTYDHPIWNEQNTGKGKAALAKIPADAKVSAAERGLIEAARGLYEKDRGEWMNRLAALHQQLPKDDEITLFYALSLYSTSRLGSDAPRAAQAADLAEEVFKRNPNHPGAAHYLIHACDAPDVAARALPAARKYAQIAPSAGHALHMPSHIFVQLGMWREVESSNIAAVKAGEEAAARRKEPIARADWHSYSWLASAKLELGKSDEVLPMIARVRELAAKEKNPVLRGFQAELALKWLSATHEYARADELLQMPPQAAEDEPGYVDTQVAVQGCHHPPYELEARLDAARARLDAAAAEGDEPATAKLAEEWNALNERLAKSGGRGGSGLGKLVAAAKLAQAHSVRFSGDIGDAIAATRAVADLEDEVPARGPAGWPPAREELGELYLRSHRFQEAQEAFAAALKQRPNRFHALEGLAEAARSAGDLRTANDAQTRLAAQVR